MCNFEHSLEQPCRLSPAAYLTNRLYVYGLSRISCEYVEDDLDLFGIIHYMQVMAEDRCHDLTLGHTL